VSVATVGDPSLYRVQRVKFDFEPWP
jgi:hypothetical protein